MALPSAEVPELREPPPDVVVPDVHGAACGGPDALRGRRQVGGLAGRVPRRRADVLAEVGHGDADVLELGGTRLLARLLWLVVVAHALASALAP